MAKTASTKPRRAIALGATAISILPPAVAGTTVSMGKGVAISVNGLVLTGAPTIAIMEPVVRQLCVIEKASPFAIGDAYRYCEEQFGEAASQVFDADLGLNEGTINVYRWVSDRIAFDIRRMDRLGIRHHFLVATLGPDRQAHWLTKAAADGEDKPWTVRQLATAIKEGEDVLPSAFWVLVLATSISDQLTLQAQLESQGRSCRAVVRRARKGHGTKP